MTSSLNRQRASTLMEDFGLDALVLCEPEAFRYATGAAMGPAGLFRRAGAGFVVVPRAVELPIGVVVADFNARALALASPSAIMRTHPIWIEKAPLRGEGGLTYRIAAGLQSLERPADFARPATFDVAISVGELVQLLDQMGLKQARLGLDLDFVPASDLSTIQTLMPGYRFTNGSHILDRLRAVKSEHEIALLAKGLALSEAGMTRLQQGARAGMLQSDLIALYRTGVFQAAGSSPHQIETAEYLTIGATPKGADIALDIGDPVKADMICSVDGYASDMSRNFVLGEPSADQRELHAIAERAFDAGLALMRPGRTLGDVYAAAAGSLAREGIGSYSRGHFGHGVGYSVFSEQWPFISSGSDVVTEPGMVLAYEIPLNVEGLASYNLEDQFLITANGAELMNRLPRLLGVMPGKNAPSGATGA